MSHEDLWAAPSCFVEHTCVIRKGRLRAVTTALRRPFLF